MSEILKEVLLNKAARNGAAGTEVAAQVADQFAPWQQELQLCDPITLAIS